MNSVLNAGWHSPTTESLLLHCWVVRSGYENDQINVRLRDKLCSKQSTRDVVETKPLGGRQEDAPMLTSWGDTRRFVARRRGRACCFVIRGVVPESLLPFRISWARGISFEAASTAVTTMPYVQAILEIGHLERRQPDGSALGSRGVYAVCAWP